LTNLAVPTPESLDELTNALSELTHEPSPAKAPHSTAPTGAVHNANPALVNSADRIASSNLLKAVHDTGGPDPKQELQLRLELARRHRREGNLKEADALLRSLLESEGPGEFDRTILIELAVLAQEKNELLKAQQIFNQYLRRYPQDPNTPEILLRQGLLYRQMGAPTLALAKFYAVMTSAIGLKSSQLEGYQRLVLQAQTEIADTHFAQGKHEEAAEFFQRLLKLGAPELNTPKVQFKLLQCVSRMGRHAEVAAQAQDFLERYPQSADEAEARFLLVIALRNLDRKAEALEQALRLLRAQAATARKQPDNWLYWQQRAGNELANHFYEEADYLRALDVYAALADVNQTTAWQLPVWYQIGLVYERLRQPEKASELYGRVLGRESEVSTNATPGLKAVIDMARWRKDNLTWIDRAEKTGAALSPASPAAASSKQ
jgi:tetratricopeptide (TPR) repeat protein